MFSAVNLEKITSIYDSFIVFKEFDYSSDIDSGYSTGC